VFIFIAHNYEINTTNFFYAATSVAVFVGEKSHLELSKGLMIHFFNLKPHINEN
jgi:hypothetical protein